MTYEINFTKVSGAGNDFVLVENLKGEIHADRGALAKALCSRPFGIGADGLLLLEPSSIADFSMQYYNADGSHGGMCGNGGRCVARYAFLSGLARSSMTFEALQHVYRAEVLDEEVRLDMKPPQHFEENIPITCGTKIYLGHFIDTGSPHFVVPLDGIDTLDVGDIGRVIRLDPRFAPEGTNVDFIELLAGSTLMLRTYERGVEAETLACGTGSVASAIVASRIYGCKEPVTVKVKSGEELIVHFKVEGHAYTSVILQGSAHILFHGKALFDSVRNKLMEPVAQ